MCAPRARTQPARPISIEIATPLISADSRLWLGRLSRFHTGLMSAAPSPDGRHDDLDAAELEGLALLVPDDARSLDADRDLYLREHSRGLTPGQYLRSYILGRFAPAGLSAPLILLVVVVVGLVAGSVAFLAPAPTTDPFPGLPLAANAAAPTGQLNGLLPVVVVGIDQQEVSIRAFRPAAIALVPAVCTSCTTVLRNVQAQVDEYGMRLLLVGSPKQTPQLEQIDQSALGGDATVASDPQNELSAIYQPSGVTVLLVHADGVVGAILTNVGPADRLEPKLAQLTRPGAPTPGG